MGAAVGVYLDHMSPDLREAIEFSEKQKYTIAEYDAALLDRETSKVFKKHGKIISTLTSRTKAQLKRTLSIKNKCPDDVYKIVGGNNHYAMFMKQLHMTKHEIEMENLKTTSKTELYDEEMLINIVGTSTNKELKAFCELYAKEKGTPLPDVFVTKTKPESQLQRFLALCFTFSRDEGKTIDEKLAAQQAADIHKAGAARLLGCDEEAIFAILTKNSRAQCAAIADQYLTQFNMKFERAINMKFKGNCAKLMLLWALPVPVAIITCIHSYEERMIIDKVAIISMVSKYDKDVLAQVDIAAEKTYDKNLLGIVQRGLSGNLFKAISGWVENATPDKGYERVTELFLENQLSFGHTLDDLFKNSEFQQRLLFLVKKETDEVERYMKEHRIKFNPHDKLDLRALGAVGTMDSFTAYHAADSSKKVPSGADGGNASAVNKYTKKEPEERATTEYDQKYKALQDYFKGFFAGHDKRNAGVFAEKEFWALMKELPLELLGMTAHEVDSMAEFSEWVTDGKVNYHEAIFELADSVITFIECKKDGESDVLAVVDALSKDGKLAKGKSELKVARHESVEEISEVPDYFMQYLYDTFKAYDFDNNGFLCQAELDAVLPVLNLGMVAKDFLIGEAKKIIHKEAVQIIGRKVQPWFLDKENDNYICLVDKDSGLFFWFNCKDESSQWADNEGEGWAGYGSRRASEYHGPEVFTNSLMDAALNGADSNKQAAGLGRGADSPGGIAAMPKSPRPPTDAEEKEMQSATADAEAKESAESQRVTNESKKDKPGIAEGRDDKPIADGGESKTADVTPPESEKKEDVPPLAVEEAKLPVPDAPASARAAGSPRPALGGASSPRATTAAQSSAKIQSSVKLSPRLSPRASEEEARVSPRAGLSSKVAPDAEQSAKLSPRPGQSVKDAPQAAISTKVTSDAQSETTADSTLAEEKTGDAECGAAPSPRTASARVSPREPPTQSTKSTKSAKSSEVDAVAQG